jgi:hypothetical protein
MNFDESTHTAQHAHNSNGVVDATAHANGHLNGHSTAASGYPDVTTPLQSGGTFSEKQVVKLAMLLPEVIEERGYKSIPDTGGKALDDLGFPSGCAPALLIPLHDVHGTPRGYQVRLDVPMERYKKPARYLFPRGQRNFISVPPRCQKNLSNPKKPLWITEGSIKADALASKGVSAIGLAGVAGWQGTNDEGGKTALACWKSIALNDRAVYLALDSDALTNLTVRKQRSDLKRYLEGRSARVFLVEVPSAPNGSKQGVDDFFANGGTIEELLATINPTGHAAAPEPPPPPEPRHFEPCELKAVETAYDAYLEMPDKDALHVVLATMAANYLVQKVGGDPVWLAVVAPPSSSKSEHVSACRHCPDVYDVAELSPAALLSGTGKKDRTAESSGGLLKQAGEFGIFAMKDFTSILSMKHETRAVVLAALREIYDGDWRRNLGTDGGVTLEWRGKIGLLAACTEAIDTHHAVIAEMGQRLIFFRMKEPNSILKNKQSKKALANIWQKDSARESLAVAVAGFIAGLKPNLTSWPELPEHVTLGLQNLSRLVATARSAITRDGKQEIISVPYPEHPARIIQQLFQIYAGLRFIGLSENECWRVTQQIGLDCLPKMRRRAFLLLVEMDGPANTAAIATALDSPTTTADRALEDLNALGILTRVKSQNVNQWEVLPDWKAAYAATNLYSSEREAF